MSVTKKWRSFQAVIFFTFDLEYCYNLQFITDQRLCHGSDSPAGGFVKKKRRYRVSMSHDMTCLGGELHRVSMSHGMTCLGGELE